MLILALASYLHPLRRSTKRRATSLTQGRLFLRDR